MTKSKIAEGFLGGIIVGTVTAFFIGVWFYFIDHSPQRYDWGKEFSLLLGCGGWGLIYYAWVILIGGVLGALIGTFIKRKPN